MSPSLLRAGRPRGAAVPVPVPLCAPHAALLRVPPTLPDAGRHPVRLLRSSYVARPASRVTPGPAPVRAARATATTQQTPRWPDGQRALRTASSARRVHASDPLGLPAPAAPLRAPPRMMSTMSDSVSLVASGASESGRPSDSAPCMHATARPTTNFLL